MRSSLSTAFGSLTTRGRAFLSSGATAVVCAAVLGLDDLARIGVLLLVLPLLAAWVTTRGRHRLGLSRTVNPTRVSVGQAATVSLALSNEGRGTTGLLLLEEQVPYTLGVRPRFVIDRMSPHWHRSVSYVVRGDARGRYTLGPMTVRADDPFGLVQVDRRFSSTTSLVVTPEVVDLPPIPLTGAWTGSGDNRPRDFAGGSAEDVTVREYRRGDDLRRVHWRSSAHAGELMVRREEQPWQSRATILLDNRRHAHRGAGRTSSLEYAVSAAASVARHLAQRGFHVRLATADGAETGPVWHERGVDSADAGPMLEALAVLEESSRVDLDTGWLGENQPSGLLVAIFGTLVPTDQPVLARMRHASGSQLAFALDVDAWARRDPSLPARRTSDEDTGGSVAMLTSGGWRAVAAGPGDPLPTVWQRLGLVGGGRRGGAPTAPPLSPGVRSGVLR